MFKKILIIGICLVALNVKAEELPIFIIGSSTAYKDETITVPITLQNNPGFSYLGVKIRYDSKKLEYVNSHLTNDFDNADLKGIEINAKKTITLYALTSSDNLIKADGKIAEIKFKVISDKIEDISVEATIDNFGNTNDEEIDISKKDGIIHIINHGEVGKEEVIEKDNLNSDKVIYKSSNEDVATVSEDGIVTFKNSGTTEIEVTDENGNSLYKKEYKVDKPNTKDKSKKKNSTFLYIVFGIFISIIIVIFLIKIIHHNIEKGNEKKENS